MKTQVLLPWVLVLALAAASAALYFSSQKKDAQLATLREEARKSENLQTELDEARTQAKAQEDELTMLRKDKQDLLRLRNEIAQMQQKEQQLTKQAQSAQAEAERAQSRVAQLTQGVQQMQQLATENQQLRTAAAQQAEYNARIKALVDASGGAASPQGQATAACINNLRLIDGAKQQWALENNKTAGAVPTSQDILAYLPNQTVPVCPAGGQYTLNAAGQSPTCSIPGHELPK